MGIYLIGNPVSNSSSYWHPKLSWFGPIIKSLGPKPLRRAGTTPHGTSILEQSLQN